MNRKIKALLIMQNKEAQIVKIPANIKFIKSQKNGIKFKIEFINPRKLIIERKGRIKILAKREYVEKV